MGEFCIQFPCTFFFFMVFVSQLHRLLGMCTQASKLLHFSETGIPSLERETDNGTSHTGLFLRMKRSNTGKSAITCGCPMGKAPSQNEEGRARKWQPFSTLKPPEHNSQQVLSSSQAHRQALSGKTQSISMTSQIPTRIQGL